MLYLLSVIQIHKEIEKRLKGPAQEGACENRAFQDASYRVDIIVEVPVGLCKLLGGHIFRDVHGLAGIVGVHVRVVDSVLLLHLLPVFCPGNGGKDEIGRAHV